jgi:hypothetical protein
VSNHPDRPPAVTTPSTLSLTHEPPPNQRNPTNRTALHLEIAPLRAESLLDRILVIGRGKFAASNAYPQKRGLSNWLERSPSNFIAEYQKAESGMATERFMESSRGLGELGWRGLDAPF